MRAIPMRCFAGNTKQNEDPHSELGWTLQIIAGRGASYEFFRTLQASNCIATLLLPLLLLLLPGHRTKHVLDLMNAAKV